MKRNVNPQWNHTFVFEDVSLDDLRDRSIELTIWDHDRFTSNDFLGGVRLNLGTGMKLSSTQGHTQSILVAVSVSIIARLYFNLNLRQVYVI